MNSKELVNWIIDNHIVENLFGANLHNELIKRSLDILRFLNAEDSFEECHIEIIWSALKVIFVPSSRQRANTFWNCSRVIVHNLMSVVFRTVMNLKCALFSLC